MKSLISRNPYNNEVLEEFEQTSEAQINSKLDTSMRCFREWRRSSYEQRQRLLNQLANTLDNRRDELARIATLEMGKTIRAARAEVEKCAKTARYFAENISVLLRDRNVQEAPQRQFIRSLPLGPLLAVMPWNFPFWQAFRAAIPAIGAGNVVVLKHASNVSRCALWIERALLEAGAPEGLLQTLLIDSSRVSSLIADPRIHAVTLTGSEAAGRSVGAAAGQYLKKCVLELGGSDPFLVLPSADLATTTEAAATARLVNNGQSCIAAKRFIIHEAIFDTFLESFQQRLRTQRLGDPLRESTDLGPLVHREAFEHLQNRIKRAEAAGARVALRSELDPSHNLFGPAVLVAPTSIGSDGGIFNEEFFGPAALVWKARDIEDAIRIANRSPFGLGSSVWSNDEREIQTAIDGLEAGMTFVNQVVASEPQLPFGGVKSSGYGRELGFLGAQEFTNPKSVSFGQSTSSRNATITE